MSAINDDINLTLNMLADVVEEYSGYIVGVGGVNSLGTFSEEEGILESNLFSTEISESSVEDDIKLHVMHKILDTGLGAYHVKDILTNTKIYGYKMPSIAQYAYDDAFVALTDTELTDIQFPLSNLTQQDEQFGGKTQSDADVQKTENASMSQMVEQHERKVSLRTADNDAATSSVAALAGLQAIGASVGNFQGKVITATEEIVPMDKFVNNDVRSPSLENPSMSAIVIKDPRYGPASRNNQHLSVFFNAISTLEMSRCTPFIDIKIFRKTRSTRDNALNPVFYMRFTKDSEDGSFVLDDISGVGSSKPVDSMISSEDSEVSYMDIFSTPQTAVNANINRNDSPIIENFLGKKTGNALSVLDPMQPMLTLDSLNISVISKGFGMQTSRVGNITMTLHDRSRLGDIAPLISIDELTKHEMMIEFGWSHPDKDINSENSIGKFLNGMRDVQIYIPTSSDISFNESSAKITMKVTAYPLNDAIDSPLDCAAGATVPLSYIMPQVNGAIERIARKKVNFLDKNPKIHPTLTLIENSSTASKAMVSSQIYSELLELLKNSSESGILTDHDFQIIKKIGELLKIPDASSATSIEGLVKQIGTEEDIMQRIRYDSRKLIRDKLKSLTGDSVDKDPVTGKETTVNMTPDFFATSRCGHHKYAKEYIESLPYDQVSFGKLICGFIGSAFAATREYSEVQVLFYPVNSSAAGARRYTTANFPLPKEEVRRKIDMELIKNSSIDVFRMFKLLSEIAESNLPVYYVSSFEEVADNSTVSNVATTLGITEEEAITKLQEEYSAKLEADLAGIYASDGVGPGRTDGFTKPMFTIDFECLPAINPPESGLSGLLDGVTDVISDFTGIGGDKKYINSGRILRIHVKDKYASVSSSPTVVNQMLSSPSLMGIAGGVPEGLESEIKVDNDISVAIQNTSNSELREYIKRFNG